MYIHVLCTPTYSPNLCTYLLLSLYLLTSFYVPIYLVQCTYLSSVHLLTYLFPVPTSFNVLSLCLLKKLSFCEIISLLPSYPHQSFYLSLSPLSLSVPLSLLSQFPIFICTFSRGTLHVFLPTTCLGPFLGFTLVPLLHIYFRVTSTKTKTTT